MSKGRPGRILVTGASGFIGRQLVSDLMAAGRPVRAMAGPRSNGLNELATADTCSLDLANASRQDLRLACEGCAVVIHAAGRAHVPRGTAEDNDAAFDAVNVEGSCRLAEAAAMAGVGRLVFVSSIGVHGDRSDSRPLTEEDPLRPHSRYAASKLRAELALGEIAETRGLPLVIVRPPLVYGARVGGNFLTLLRAVDRGLPLPLGLVRSRRNAVALRNLSQFLALASEHPRSPGESFLIADRERPSTAELVLRLADLMGRRLRLIPVPPPLLRAGAAILRKPGYAGLWNSLEIDTAKAETLLGWRQPVRMEQALAETVAWYRSRRDRPRP